MKIYLSGPISNNPNFRSEFESAATHLRRLGHHVINPVDLIDSDTAWNEAMRLDLIEMLQCDAVAILHTRQSSKGQSLEMLVATQLDIPCMDYTEYSFACQEE